MSVQPPTTVFPTQPMGAVSQLSEVRARFVGWLRKAEVDAERIDDLSVVLSELGANAIRETPDGAPRPEVTARIVGSRLELTVTNEVAPDAGPADAWDLADPLRTGGRGLLLVSAFVDDVEVDVAERRLVVRCIASV